MIAPAPHIKRIGSIAFVNNNYGTDLYGPNGGFPQEVYDSLLLYLDGTLTISGGTTDGVPVAENPKTFIKSVEVKVAGGPASLTDSFVELPLTDLHAFNCMEYRDLATDPQETPLVSGAVGVYVFRGVYVLPFMLEDMSNPYKGIFPSGRLGQVTLRVKFGTAEDLVAGGDRTKAITACSVTVKGTDYSFDPNFGLAADLVYHQRVMILSKTINAVAQNDQDYVIPRTNAFMRALQLRQVTVDANGVETPTALLIRPTDPVVLMLDGDRKFDLTWEDFEFLNTRTYKRPMPAGTIIIDTCPRGDEEVLRKMLMTNFGEIKVRCNNGSVANGTLRITALKYAFFQ